ncbi:glucan endo-1,6-beta-glucosidase [Mycena floridula]|nr:glucan endo-1,6-beta-glucosidase [Mycena floridula]
MARAMQALTLLVPFIQIVASQQIWDIWQTVWDRSHLFTSLQPSTPINFVSPSTIGAADIVVDETLTFQTIWGLGASLTDSSALKLNTLKSQNPNNYWALMDYLFNPTDGANSAGMTYIRVPLGASDFSASAYSYDDSNGDTTFSSFNINKAPSYLFSILKDIHGINNLMKVHVVPWSPPGWMKSSGTMDGGSLQSNLVTTYATYLLKCLQGFNNNGIPLYAISIQNEPLNSNPTYPTSTLTPTQEAQIGVALRSLMNSNGFSSVKLIGFEHNWSDASSYPIQLMNAAPNTFDGVAFHCYEGSVDQQDAFHSAYPNKERFPDILYGMLWRVYQRLVEWYMNNIFIGSLTHNSHTGMMWNIALDGNGNPKLPGTTSCGGPGCRPVAQINTDGSYAVQQEFYAIAQASKAILPRDVGGPWGKRIKVSVGGRLGGSSALTVGAYVTGRVNPSDWLRYSLVVLNQYDHPDGPWQPTPVQTTIEFQDMQATYTFPVGITTLWWYAPANSFNATSNSTLSEAYAESYGQQSPLQFNRIK